jgi:hypothetical protein
LGAKKKEHNLIYSSSWYLGRGKEKFAICHSYFQVIVDDHIFQKLFEKNIIK